MVSSISADENSNGSYLELHVDDNEPDSDDLSSSTQNMEDKHSLTQKKLSTGNNWITISFQALPYILLSTGWLQERIWLWFT